MKISYFAGYDLISRSSLFDTDFYRRSNPDLEALGYDPIAHYMEVGASLGRDPCALFDTAYYREQCRAIGESPDNALIHFLRVGAARGLRIHPAVAPERPVLSTDVIHLDSLVFSRAADGALELRGAGWLAPSRPVVEISLEILGEVVGYATIGLNRADVAETYPDYPGLSDCGFAFVISRLPDGIGGQAELIVNVSLASGDPVRGRFPLDAPWGLDAASNPSPGPPRDAADQALLARMASADLPPIRIQIDQALVNEQDQVVLEGWVIGLAPVVAVDVWLDGQRLGPAEYGARRDDVAASFPDYFNPASSGFRFVADGRQLGEGKRTFAIRCATQGGVTREVATPLILRPSPAPVDAPPAPEARVHCDEVRLGKDGSLLVSGWAICGLGVEGVLIFLDGVLVGEARIGLDRPDVGNSYPEFPGSRNAGFTFLGTVAADGVAGEHLLSVRVRTSQGRAGGVRLPVTAVEVARPPGAASSPEVGDTPSMAMSIDAPGIANGAATAPVRGSLSIAGWALAARGIEAIDVGIDGARVTSAYYGVRRDDVAAAFPDRAGALLSGFAVLLPNRVLPKGDHTVNLVARDKAGGVLTLDFTVHVEELDEEESGPWSLRRRIPQSEVALKDDMLWAAGWRPTFVLLLRVGSSEDDVAGARLTLQSLRDQAYDGWRLVVALAASGAAVRRLKRDLLLGFDDLADRITWVNERAGSRRLDRIFTEKAPADRATLCGIVSGGDELGVDALLAFAVWTALNRDADFIYCDERRLNPGTGKLDTFFKPDWSPDLALSCNYIGRLWCAKPDLLRKTGATLRDMSVHGDYDLSLRCVELADSIGHVPAVLVERPPIADETPDVQRAALERAMGRRGISGRVVDGRAPGLFEIERTHAIKALVSIIIPTCAAKGYIKTCIDTLRAKTTYRNFEIVCIENIPAAAIEWRVWLKAHADEVLTTEEPFNWSRFNNLAAAKSKGEYLVFLNDDIEIISPNWLDVLLSHMTRPEVGIVGPLLLYPDRSIQHAGLFLCHMGTARHAFRFAPEDDPGYFGLALSERNMIGVTGACMMVRRDVYDRAGGFDETHTVINNDVDFCLRIQQLGLLVVYTPRTRLIHHELASRSEISDDYDTAAFDQRWGDSFLRGDPYYHPRLSKDQDDYGPDREPLRVVYPSHPLMSRDRVRNLLLVKIDHIGDCVTALPAVRRLRDLFPNARLCILAAPSTRSIWSLVAGVDEVIPFQFFHTRSGEGQIAKTEEELARLRETLAPYRFDLAIDLRKSPDSRHLLQYTGARFRAGFGHQTNFPWLDVTLEWEGDPKFQPKRAHVSDDLIRLVQAVELACQTDRTVITRPAGPSPLAPDVAAELHRRPVVAIHPAAGTPTREWPAASFAQLIDLLARDFDVNVAIIGGPGDRAIVDEILASVRHGDRVTSLLGQLSLEHLADFLPACALFVGNNSGPSHLAAALGVPTVAVHSGVIASEEWGPQGPVGVAIRRDMSCAPCYISTADECPRGLACLTRLTAGEVLEVCRPLLATALVSRAGPALVSADSPVHA